MKNQYAGDIGDYGKYGMLRFFASRGIKIGINWYLTSNDDRSDGNHTEYLLDARMRAYDPAVYDAMKCLVFDSGRSVHMVEQNGILEGMTFYHEPLDTDFVYWRERKGKRLGWHQKALEVLSGSDLVFADPDNGLSVVKKPTQKGSEKFIFPNEVMDYYHRGQNIVYYHHRSRKNDEGWLTEKTQMKKYLPDARLFALAFRRWSHRVYIFVVHEVDADMYVRMIADFMSTAWGTYKVDGKVPFTYEVV